MVTLVMVIVEMGVMDSGSCLCLGLNYSYMKWNETCRVLMYYSYVINVSWVPSVIIRKTKEDGYTTCRALGKDLRGHWCQIDCSANYQSRIKTGTHPPTSNSMV